MKKILFLLVSFLLLSCTEEEKSQKNTIVVQQTGDNFTSRLGSTFLTQPIFAGQNIEAGYLEISNNGTNFEVEYFAAVGWKFSELHLYVGELINAPTTGSGNPIPGRFDNKITFTTPVTSYSFVIPNNQINIANGCVIVAAHSKMKKYNTSGSVIQQESGWGGTNQFSGANWATYSNYCLSTNTDGEVK